MAPAHGPLLAAGIDEEPATGSYFVSAYPPFSQWNHAGARDFEARLTAPAGPRAAPLGLYVHIPFCVLRCQYCYYLSYAGETDERVDRYVDAVLSEAAAYAETALLKGRAAHFVYFGGGTPSLLSPAAIRRLLSGLAERLPSDRLQEVSFECAPQTVTPDKLAAMQECGVTRVSLGVQQMDDRVLELSGRVHAVEQVECAYRQIRGFDFQVVNLDLMVGMVGETDESFDRSLERVIEMAPDSVTIYQLEIPLNTPLFRALRSGRVETPAAWDTKRRRLARAFVRLEDAGYAVRSAYTAVQDLERHRFVYQDELYAGADLLGIGVSSFSYLDGIHQQNLTALDAYVDTVEAGELPLARGYSLSDDERLVREVVLQLKLGRIDREAILRKFAIDPVTRFAEQLEMLQMRGWATGDDREITLTRDGLLRADRLLTAFYLPEHRHVRYS